MLPEAVEHFVQGSCCRRGGGGGGCSRRGPGGHLRVWWAPDPGLEAEAGHTSR